ncbi:hypothetical protein ACXR2T_14685 [Leucobacter sp. HY1910]
MITGPAAHAGSDQPAAKAALAESAEPAESADSAAPDHGRRTNRRASRPAPAGVDPKPLEHTLTARAREDRPEGWGDASAHKQMSAHDAALKRDRPPHWG